MREDSIADKQGQAAVDLNGNDVARLKLHKLRQRQAGSGQYAARRKPHMVHLPAKTLAPGRIADLQLILHARAHQGSEERRVGKEGVRPGRSRGWTST